MSIFDFKPPYLWNGARYGPSYYWSVIGICTRAFSWYQTTKVDDLGWPWRAITQSVTLCACLSEPITKIWMKIDLQGGPKKVSLRSIRITSSNTDRFSKFFHCHILQEICNKVIIKYSTSPQTCRYTTLWNIYVRKLVDQWNVSHHFVSENWNIMNICNIPDHCCW